MEGLAGVHFRHDHVHQNEIDGVRVVFVDFDGVTAVFGENDRVAKLDEHAGDDIPDHVFIVDKQDGLRAFPVFLRRLRVVFDGLHREEETDRAIRSDDGVAVVQSGDADDIDLRVEREDGFVRHRRGMDGDHDVVVRRKGDVELAQFVQLEVLLFQFDIGGRVGGGGLDDGLDGVQKSVLQLVDVAVEGELALRCEGDRPSILQNLPAAFDDAFERGDEIDVLLVDFGGCLSAKIIN